MAELAIWFVSGGQIFRRCYFRSLSENAMTPAKIGVSTHRGIFYSPRPSRPRNSQPQISPARCKCSKSFSQKSRQVSFLGGWERAASLRPIPSGVYGLFSFSGFVSEQENVNPRRFHHFQYGWAVCHAAGDSSCRGWPTLFLHTAAPQGN